MADADQALAESLDIDPLSRGGQQPNYVEQFDVELKSNTGLTYNNVEDWLNMAADKSPNGGRNRIQDQLLWEQDQLNPHLSEEMKENKALERFDELLLAFDDIRLTRAQRAKMDQSIANAPLVYDTLDAYSTGDVMQLDSPATRNDLSAPMLARDFISRRLAAIPMNTPNRMQVLEEEEEYWEGLLDDDGAFPAFEWQMTDESLKEWATENGRFMAGVAYSDSRYVPIATGTAKAGLDVMLGLVTMDPVSAPGTLGTAQQMLELAWGVRAVFGGAGGLWRRTRNLMRDADDKIAAVPGLPYTNMLTNYINTTWGVELGGALQDVISTWGEDAAAFTSAWEVTELDPQQQEYSRSRNPNDYRRPGGPRRGFHILGWGPGERGGFELPSRAVDLFKDEMWQSVDGVADYSTYWTPLSNISDDRYAKEAGSLNALRGNVWNKLNADYATAVEEGTVDAFINGLIRFDWALEQKSGLMFSNAERHRSNAATSYALLVQGQWAQGAEADVAAGREFGVASVDQMTGSQAHKLLLQNIREKMIESGSPWGFHTESVQSYQQEFAAAQGLLEFKKVIGAWFAHQQSGGSGRLDRHVGTFDIFRNPTGSMDVTTSSLRSPIYQMPGLGFHEFMSPAWTQTRPTRAAPSYWQNKEAPWFISNQYHENQTARPHLLSGLQDLGETIPAVNRLVYSIKTSWSPSFNEDWWVHHETSGGRSDGFFGEEGEQIDPEKVLPWMKILRPVAPEDDTGYYGDSGLSYDANPQTLIVLSDEMERVQSDLDSLNDAEKVKVSDELFRSWRIAYARGQALNRKAASSSPGVHRTVSEMYRNAYESDAAVLWELLESVDPARADEIADPNRTILIDEVVSMIGQ